MENEKKNPDEKAKDAVEDLLRYLDVQIYELLKLIDLYPKNYPANVSNLKKLLWWFSDIIPDMKERGFGCYFPRYLRNILQHMCVGNFVMVIEPWMRSHDEGCRNEAFGKEILPIKLMTGKECYAYNLMHEISEHDMPDIEFLQKWFTDIFSGDVHISSSINSMVDRRNNARMAQLSCMLIRIVAQPELRTRLLELIWNVRINENKFAPCSEGEFIDLFSMYSLTRQDNDQYWLLENTVRKSFYNFWYEIFIEILGKKE